VSHDVFAPLAAAGLDLHAVFDPAALGPDLFEPGDRTDHAQLILIGHTGPRFWQAMQASRPDGNHPMDNFARRVVGDWLGGLTDLRRVRWLYPGDTSVSLQALGARVGWHHDSLLKVGIHPHWGTWFAYRALVLADTCLPLTPTRAPAPGPCPGCADAPCMDACPASAVQRRDFALERCLAHRLEPQSACASTCHARLACPLGGALRYPPEQIEHMYRHSLEMVRVYRNVQNET